MKTAPPNFLEANLRSKRLCLSFSLPRGFIKYMYLLIFHHNRKTVGAASQ